MHSLLIGVLVGSLALTAGASATESERFNRWLDASWEETLQRDPILATTVGDARYNAQMIDTGTAQWRVQNHNHLASQLQQLRAFDAQTLSAKDRISLGILQNRLEQSLRAEQFPSWMQPFNQLVGMPNLLAQMGSGHSLQPFLSTKDYDDWIARLTLAVPMLDTMIDNMRVGIAAGVTQPQVVMEKVLPQLARLVVAEPEQSIFWEPVKAWPAAVAPADRERITNQLRALLKSQVIPVYRRLHEFFRDDYIPKARTSTAWSALPGGEQWYAYLVQLHTSTTLSADEIHALGLQEVARILGGMDAVRRQLGFNGDIKAFFKHLQEDTRYYYRKPEDLLAGFRNLQTRINALLPRLFDIAPKANYEVREVEAFRAQGAAGGEYWAPSADGTRPGVFYINTFDLKAIPIYCMETLSLHEASPGHHFQMSISQEDQHLPKFRRFDTFYAAYVEGWALCAESLGRELGLFTDPSQWYGRLSDENLRAMRLVVDTGLHRKGWSRQQAIDYMLANSSMAQSDVASEVDRYIAMPAQALAYKIGQIEISQLRREAELALGARFDLKQFHRLLLTSGQMPLSVLRTMVKDWVQAVAAGK